MSHRICHTKAEARQRELAKQNRRRLTLRDVFTPMYGRFGAPVDEPRKGAHPNLRGSKLARKVMKARAGKHGWKL